MKIAIISDIHGNHYALSAVLKKAAREGVERLLILGDVVGYYYHPELILDMLSNWNYEIIKGNHEEILQNLNDNKIDAELLVKKYGRGHEQALKNLTQERLQWLFSLPTQISITIDGVSFEMNHGTPWDKDEYLYPDATINKFEKCNSVNHDFVLIGHSHYAFSYQCKHSILINCGSVGQSRQKGGVANWAIVNTINKCYEIKETHYETSFLLNEIEKFDPNLEYISKVLTR